MFLLCGGGCGSGGEKGCCVSFVGVAHHRLKISRRNLRVQIYCVDLFHL